MQISVAMATYNGQRFLDAQLRSLETQTHLPAELVVSDDGSTDDTLEIIRAFASRAPFPVRILPAHERLGFADNFLYAAAACVSPLVAWSDQDDIWRTHKLATAHDRMMTNDSLLAMHRLTLTDEHMKPIGEYDQGIARDICFEPLEIDPYVTGWGNTMLFRRELATLIPRTQRPRQPQDRRLLSHDTWIYVLAAALGRVSHIREPLILYRQHGANVYGTTAESRRARIAAHLSTVFRVPITDYRERALFDTHLADLLGKFARDADDDWKEPAIRAAERIAERAQRRSRRVRLYDEPHTIARMRIYIEMLRAPVASHEAAKARKRAIAKDLVLGVTGFGVRN